MCLAIYKPAGAWASKANLHEGFKSNPHGSGYAFHDGSKVQIRKGFFTWNSFWNSFKKDVHTETQALIHFRIATKGEKIAENCHPFQLPAGAMMHNGPCINWRHCAGSATQSDSRQFADDFIGDLTSVQVARLKPMIEDFAGTEKIIFLFDNKEVVICNADNGHWANGCWWSNRSYEKTIITPMAANWAWNRFDREAEEADEAANKPLLGTQLKPRMMFSERLQAYLPREITVDNETYSWIEAPGAYIPEDIVDQFVYDDDYIYENNSCSSLVSEVIQDFEHLVWFLHNSPDFPARAYQRVTGGLRQIESDDSRALVEQE